MGKLKRKLRRRKTDLIENQIKKKAVLQSRSHKLDIEKCVSCQKGPGSRPLCEYDNGTDYKWVLQNYLGMNIKLKQDLLQKSKICEKCSKFLDKLMVFKDRLVTFSHVRDKNDDGISDSDSDGGNMTLSQMKTKKNKTKPRPKKGQNKHYWVWRSLDDSSNCSWYSDKSEEEEQVRYPVVKSTNNLKKSAPAPITIKKEEDLDDDLDLVLNTEVYD